MDIDRPLEEMIDEKRSDRRKAASARNARGGRGGARGGRGAARGGGPVRGAGIATAAVVPVAVQSTGPVRNKYSGSIAANNKPGGGKGAVPAIPLMADGSKIIVSNLPTDVTENQIRDLFSQTVGPVTRLSLSYDKNGKSTGVATIELKRPGDGQVAFKQYNGRLVDGTRPMKVEILFDPTRLPPPPLDSRIAPPPMVAVAPVMAPVVAASGAPRGASRGRAARGRGGRGRGRGGKTGDEREKKTEQDLDAEMEDYQKTLAPAA